MTGEQRHALRAAIDRRRRELEQVATDARLHGRPTTYRDGCRCEECRAAATAARRRSRERQRASDERRQRLLAACAPGSPVGREAQVTSVLRMLSTASKRNSRGGAGRDLDGRMAGAAKEES